MLGEVQQFGAHRLVPADVAAFRQRFAGAETGTIPSMLLCCLYMRLLVAYLAGRVHSLGSPGVDAIRWPARVEIDDVLRARTKIIATRALESRPEMGLIQQRAELVADRGAIVLDMTTNALVARSPASR